MCGDLGMKRADIRAALVALQVAGRVVEADLPQDLRKGRKQAFLCPSNIAERFGDIDPKPDENAQPSEPIPPDVSISPPYREMDGGDIAAPSFPSVPSISPNPDGDIGDIGGIEQRQPENGETEAMELEDYTEEF